MNQLLFLLLGWLDQITAAAIRREVRSEPSRGDRMSPEDRAFYLRLQQLPKIEPEPIEPFEPLKIPKQIIVTSELDRLKSRIAERLN